MAVLGLPGGIGTHPGEVPHMKRTASRLFGDDYCWSMPVRRSGTISVPASERVQITREADRAVIFRRDPRQ